MPRTSDLGRTDGRIDGRTDHYSTPLITPVSNITVRVSPACGSLFPLPELPRC